MKALNDSRLDTVFLTMPIAWKGTLAQYVGPLATDSMNGQEDVLVVELRG